MLVAESFVVVFEELEIFAVVQGLDVGGSFLDFLGFGDGKGSV